MKQLKSVVTDFSKRYICLKFNVEKSCFLPQFFVVYSVLFFNPIFFISFCSAAHGSVLVSLFGILSVAPRFHEIRYSQSFLFVAQSKKKKYAQKWRLFFFVSSSLRSDWFCSLRPDFKDLLFANF